MLFKFPKDDKNFSWTSHVKGKMLQYRLSEQKIKTVMRNPNRKEVGIAPNTSAVMKRNDTPKRKEEIWVMFQIVPQNGTRGQMQTTTRRPRGRASPSAGTYAECQKSRIISAWRYPGISPEGKKIPIPDDILEELENNLE